MGGVTTLNPLCLRQSRHVDDRRHLLIRSIDLTKSLDEAISSFEVLSTPCLWAKRDSSSVGVTTMGGVTTLNPPCLRQSRHVDDRRHLMFRSMDLTMSLGEAISSFKALTTPCLLAKRFRHSKRLLRHYSGRSDFVIRSAYYAITLGEARLLLRRSDGRGEAKRREPEQ